MAISCVKKKAPVTEVREKAVEWWNKYPNVIFVAGAEGMGKNGVLISLHKNFTEFHRFVKEQLQYWEDEIAEYDTMLISLQGIIVKPLSLAYLAELEETS